MSIMQTSKSKVYLYNTREEIESKSVPYATEDAEVLERVISRFVAWAQMIATHPNIAAEFGDRSRDHIQLATDLRTAMNNRRHPNVVLPMSKYFAAKMFSEITKSVAKEPAFIAIMERENRLWAGEYSI
jgi:hypothetical protein